MATTARVTANGWRVEGDTAVARVGGEGWYAVVAPPADTTPPTLSSPTWASTSDTAGTATVDTNEGNGTLYLSLTTSATSPSVAQVKAGQDHTGAAAAYAANQSVSSTGTKNFTPTGLAASTTYYAHFQHVDAATNDSTVVTSAGDATDPTPGDATPPTLSGSITIGTRTATTIAISWPAGADNVAVTSYEVSSDNGSTWTDTGNTDTSATISGLAENTAYTVKVRAKDAAGNVSTPAISQATSTLEYPRLTSSALKNNTGTLHLSAPFTAFVHDTATGSLVLKKTSLTSHASTGVVTFKDVTLTLAAAYRVVWQRTDTGAEGLETLTTT